MTPSPQLVPRGISSARPWFSDEDLAFILENVPGILRGQMTMAKWVQEFERQIAAMAGTRYALVAHTCTAAMEIALKSLEIGPGDEVLVPVQTFMATAIAVRNAGARPVFCDISPKTHCLDPADMEKRITPKTRAVMLVHYGGLITPDLPAIEALCKRHSLHLIEDAAHAHGASKAGRNAGSIGAFGCFSYYATKVLTTAGEGGALTTNDEKLYKIAQCYQYRGQDLDIEEEQIFVRPGHNVRMTEFQALCGVAQHKHLKEFVQRRNAIARRYDAVLKAEAPDVERIEPPADTVHAYWKHTINLPPDVSRDRFQKEAAEKYKVPFAWSYWPPIHLQPVFRRLYGSVDGQLPQAEDVTGRLVNFPMHVRLSDEDVDYVLESFLACYKALRGSRRPAEEDRTWYLKRV